MYVSITKRVSILILINTELDEDINVFQDDFRLDNAVCDMLVS